MRTELYKALCEKLRSIGDGEIKHIDLWNRNVEFIEQEEAWERPAVFIEICPITWEQTTGGKTQKIQKVIDGLAGEKFHALHLAETYTNHDHEEIVESIEVYRLRGVRHI